jgi:DNA-binding winged helix-turn-helix (wHTH) protein/Tol biopolymer transport system component
MQLPAAEPECLRVGEFEVDLRSGEVRHNGDKIKLQRRPFQILVALLQHPGEVVTREEIRRNLWPGDTFVDFEHGINTAINKLREALGDDAESPRFIETLPRYGYRFIVPVETVAPNGVQNGFHPQGVKTAPSEQPIPTNEPGKRRLTAVFAGVGGALLAAVALATYLLLPSRKLSPPPRNTWVQITDFPDSATQPALSPDGRMVAFIRGTDTFITRGEVYVKTLPSGDAVQLTDDKSNKMAPAFSPDGSRVAYTRTEPSSGWKTFVVPAHGGAPAMLMANAAGLIWVDGQHVMYSEIKGGFTMGVATAAENRTGERDVYVPATQSGMAHRSWLSPDGRQVLISEMDTIGWRPCRVVPFDGSTRGDIVGPKNSRCTYAGWSPDGRTMYFSADTGNGFHLWRQGYPRGEPEQITFGPTEEEGIAVAPDGASLVTSAGMRESTVWVHDAKGDRRISGEGYAQVQGMGNASGAGETGVFSPDGKRAFYIVRAGGSRANTFGELWMTDLDTGQSSAVLPGVPMTGFSLSPDSRRVTYTTEDANEVDHVWITSLDRQTPPRQITPAPARAISFGPGDDIHFLMREGGQEFLYRMGPHETSPQRMSPHPVEEYVGLSPNGTWLISGYQPVVATPLAGGPIVRICNFCGVEWGPDGKLLYLRFRDFGDTSEGKTIAVGLAPGEELPKLPPFGLQSIEDTKGLNIIAEIDNAGMPVFAPGPNPGVYAYNRLSVQRNLYRIPLR